ncbi:MAG: hypothetical protein CFE24_10165 [Flavobacterium sp. BFFFF2]|nr:MAG: hypothetical protein CFE24_10165 [Flavobacterium sp. BFFFF2]
MKKNLLITALLLLATHGFSQGMGNQGNTRAEGIPHGVGTGPSLEPYQLTGRAVVRKPLPQTKNCNQSGRVIMDIMVDQTGTVLEAKIGRGTTTKAVCLVEACTAAALATTWSKDPNAVDKQRGKIIYNFKID